MNPISRLLSSIGEMTILTLKTIREFFRPPFEFNLWIVQLEQGGVHSWSITVLTAIFTGMVMASQFAIGLEPFGASLYTGKLVCLGIVRELGPVLTALLVGGRVGAGFTAALGTCVLGSRCGAASTAAKLAEEGATCSS